MKILFIGDVVGEPGIKAVQALLPRLVAELGADLVIANGENASGGFGLNKSSMERLFSCGVTVITTGNHIWDKMNIAGALRKETRLLRPANYPSGSPGAGSTVVAVSGGAKVGVINVSGRVFMDALDCPFRTVLEHVERIEKETDTIIIDLHAEATSEKTSMGWMLDGRVSAVLGTHTHVQTADERVLPGGTAYITDAGMTGAFDSVIGSKKEIVIKRFLTGLPLALKVAEKDVRISGVWVETDPQTGRAVCIERVQRRHEKDSL